MLFSEIWKQITLTYQINGGAYYWWYFPFQLCSTPMYMCLVLGLAGYYMKDSPGKAILTRGLLAYLMDFGLLAGIFAFLDTSGMHYTFAPLTIHSFAWHFLMIFIGICAGRQAIKESQGRQTEEKNSGDTSLGGFRFSALLYLIFCGIATIINLTCYKYGVINMFYISPKYVMNQVIARDFVPILGNTGAIIGYMLAPLVGAGLLHLMWRKLSK